MADTAEQDQIEAAYEICKLQAAADGTFDDKLMRHWFKAAWETCAQIDGLTPPTQIEESITIRASDGGFTLSHEPTGPVEIYDNYRLVAVLPPSLERSRCDPAFCCLCNPWARYMTGQESCEISARFIQAVARVFAYIVENRGDSLVPGTADMGAVLRESGAMAFLEPQYVA